MIAILVYHAGLSYRKTSQITRGLESFSIESLRKWYMKCISFFCPQRKQRSVIAVDETKVKWEERQIYIWNAIDIEDYVDLAVYVSVSRTSFDAIYFLKKVLNICEKKAVHPCRWRPMVAWLSSGSGNGNTFYFDGQPITVDWQDHSDPNGIWFDDQSTNTHSIGAFDRASPDGHYHWNGLLDEVRITNIPLSTAWIVTEHTNQNNPASFLWLGPEQPHP